ncbi:5497_t:CDS:10 [Acaulospora morrowiae]|uniref:5497_t:CDS:1 n=1 Tax=Acaulospora morrowiae TaxID=94023 RepID=A0A9N8ZXF8_9GLOM|nr:5497_t:CDS:10 [Acaulospora morrowiae]
MSSSSASRFLLSLPNEITMEILGHTDLKDINSISLANRKFHKLLQDDYVWQLMCKIQYPESRITDAQKDLDENETLKQLSTTSIPESKTGENISIFENLKHFLRSLYPRTEQDAEPSTDVSPPTENNEMEWMNLYKYLSNPISFIAKEKGVTWLDCHDGPFRGQNHWETEDGESAYGKIVHLNYVWWFDVVATLKCVQPGTYDVIWRFKVDGRSFGLNGLNFKTQVLANSYEELDTPEKVVQEKNHVSGSNVFRDIKSKGTWAEYCLPYQIDVPKERIVDGENVWYDVRCKIYNHNGSQKCGLDDYVWKLMCKNQYPESRILEAQKDLDKDRVLKQLFTTVPEPITATPCTRQEAESSTNVPSVTSNDEMEWAILYKYLCDYHFLVKATLRCVRPGTYDIIWRFRVYGYSSLEMLNFRAYVLANSYKVDTPETVVQEKKSAVIQVMSLGIQSKGGWIRFISQEIVVPEERLVDGKPIWYDVVCNIYAYPRNPVNGLCIDYVKLRSHQDGREHQVFE